MSEKQFLRHGLNGNQLKLIAVISMLCDHAAIRLLAYGLIPALYVAGENMAAERWNQACFLYTSDAADEEDSVDLGGPRIIKKKKQPNHIPHNEGARVGLLISGLSSH